MAELQLKIDPSGAVQGARVVQRSLEEMAKAAEAAEGSIEGISGAASGMSQTVNGTRVVTRTMEEMSAAARQVEQGIGRARDAMGRFSQVGGGMASGIRAANDELQRQRTILETINRATGVSGRNGAFGRADDIRAYGAELDALRAKFSPLASISQTYTRSVSEIRDAHRLGAISAREMKSAIEEAGLVANAQQRVYTRWREGLEDVASGARLTGTQLLNLSRQGNDALTMLASGSSITEVFATQLGQVIGALEEGPGGLRGSLEAIKNGVVSFTAGLGPAGIALGALAASAVAFGLAIRKEVKPLQDVIKAQSQAVLDLRDAYGLAADAAENYGKRTAQAVRVGVSSQTKTSLERAKDEYQKRADSQFVGRDNFRFANPRNAQYEVLRVAFNELRASIEAGMPAFTAFEDKLAGIPAEKLVGEFGEVIRANREWAASLAPLQAAIQGTTAIIDGSAEAMARYATAMNDLRALTPDLRSQAQQINDAFAKAAAGPADGDEMVARFQRQKALAADTAGAVELLNAARAEGATIGLGAEAQAIAAVEQEYGRLRAQYAGNTQALIELDKWRAQAIDNAGAQASFDRQQEQAKEQEAAAKRATDEAQRYAEATRSRISGLDQSVAAQQMELELLGQSEGATAALRFEFQALSAAKQAAAAAGTVVSDEEIAAIQSAADEIGQLTEQFKAMQEAQEQARRLAETFDDLAFERSIMGLPDAEQRVRETIRSVGVDYASMDGQRLAGELRYNAALQETQDRLRETGEIGRDAFMDIVDAFMSGENAIEGILGGLRKMAQEFARIGLEKLTGLFTGGGQASGTGAGLLGALVGGGQRVAANPSVVSSLSSVPTPTPAHRATSAALAETVTQKVSSNLLTSMLGAGKSRSHITGLNQEFATALNNMIDAAPAAVQASLTINSGFRSVARQAELFDAALKKYGSPAAARKWVAPPGNSQHNKGMAADLGYGDVSARQWVHANAGKYGLAFPLGHENWHIELAGARGGTSKVATDQRVLAKGVSQGLEDYQRKVGSPESYNAGRFDPGSPRTAGASSGTGGLMSLLKSPFGQGAMNAFGAFGAGVSGGPLSGALTGGLGAIGMGLGPVGIIAGVGAGILGSLAKNLFNKKEREAAHRQQAAEWEQMLPQWREFQERMKTGAGPTSNLRKAFAADDQALSDFMRVGGKAWKYGSENSTALHWQVGLDRYAYQDRAKSAFRDAFATTEGSLLAGQGLEGPYNKGRDAIRQASETILTFVDDARVAFGDAAAEVDRAKKAGVEQLRSVLRGADDMTDVQNDLLTFEGAAAGLRTELVKLGLTSEEVAKIVGEDLAIGIGKVRDNFEQSIRDRVDELDGKGYLVQVRDLIETFAKTQADAARLGADTSLLPDFFAKQAQNIVNGAELTGDAFADLIKAFPTLSGVVKEFVDEAEKAAEKVGMTVEEVAEALNRAAVSRYERAVQERADAEAALRTEYERTVDRINGITDFLSDMRLDDSLSTLSGKEQFDEAQRLYRDTLFKANGGDQDAQDKLLGVSQDYLEEAKAYYATSEAYGAVYKEIEATLKASASRMETELDVARRQASFLEEIAGGTKGLSALLEKYLEADRAVGGATSDLDANRQWGIRPVANRKNVAEFRAAGLPEYTGNFGPDTWPQIEAWLNTLSLSQRAQAMQIMTANNAIGYASGGYTGMGGVNEVAGTVHRGEVVWSQNDVRAWGGPARVDAMRVARVPDMPMMQPARNDNRELVAALGRVESLLRLNIQTTGAGLQRVAVATEEGARSSRQQELASRRASNLAAAS